ncbi:MAG: iron ABC transporter substrate-binding protein [Spirochaetes bacterium]|nr:iron ABC transporter substrate-binding protein [Spirochaetota bacterium]
MKILKQTFLSFILLIFFSLTVSGTQKIKIADSLGRVNVIPSEVKHVICSGSGALRLLTYLGAQDKITAVDDIEVKKNIFDARPYALVNPQFKKYPIFGEFRGFDNPELILGLKPFPEIIFKIYSASGYNAVELEDKTGIPVIVLNYGDLSYNKEEFYKSLRIMGKCVGKEKKAKELINFINQTIDDLNKRTHGIPENKKKKCYIGGVAQRGPQAFHSTEPAYPPFKMINAVNLAFDKNKSIKELAHAYIAKEMIIQWDPEIIFIDLATLQSESKGNALYELKNDPAYKELSAVKKGEVYGLLPYNWYSINYESILANAYYLGKLLYPENFKDIDPVKKADEIFAFFVGKPVFREMDNEFDNLVFKKLKVEIRN